jgi:hypothetical protein
VAADVTFQWKPESKDPLVISNGMRVPRKMIHYDVSEGLPETSKRANEFFFFFFNGTRV